MKFESKILDENLLKQMNKSYIVLSKGFVHYQIDGPVNGELIVLVHGFSTPFFIWDKNFDFLVNNGFRVLRFDLYGRGYSARPKCKYTLELFENQIIELLNCLELDNQKFTIVGLSMGGGIATYFTSKHPDRIKRLILFDPIGFPQKIDFNKRLLSMPVIGSIIFKLIGNKVLVSGLTMNFKDFDKIEKVSNFTKRFMEQMEYKGFQHAIVSTYQNLPFYGLKDEYTKVGQSKIPTLLFWAIDDQVIPYSCNEHMRAAIPQAEFYSLENTGHNSNYESSDIVNPIILEFLKKYK